LLAVAFLLAMLTGCAAHDNNVKTLRQGYDALAVQQYSTAMDDANAVLAANADGTLPAEAHYLRGRVFEETAMASPPSAAQATNLQNARDEYRQAISLPHRTDLDGDARAGVALVAFYQDDYSTALQQWQTAYPELKKPEDRVRTLYRMGQAAQRLGQWALADQYFQQVQQQAPGTDVAANARMHEGARAFYVQVVASVSANQATALQRQLNASVIAAQIAPGATTASGHLSVRSGPMPTYGQAKSLRDRLLSKYPNATILP
jgi:tetratricopeptide (TPR) repeat protein